MEAPMPIKYDDNDQPTIPPSDVVDLSTVKERTPTTQQTPPPPSAGDLTDTSPMPFGKYQGVLMQDVSPGYLHWLWENSSGFGKSKMVLRYIKGNLDALRMENKDLIWKRRTDV